jgi:hypothetical protein
MKGKTTKVLWEKRLSKAGKFPYVDNRYKVSKKDIKKKI